MLGISVLTAGALVGSNLLNQSAHVSRAARLDSEFADTTSVVRRLLTFPANCRSAFQGLKFNPAAAPAIPAIQVSALRFPPSPIPLASPTPAPSATPSSSPAPLPTPQIVGAQEVLSPGLTFAGMTISQIAPLASPGQYSAQLSLLASRADVIGSRALVQQIPLVLETAPSTPSPWLAITGCAVDASALVQGTPSPVPPALFAGGTGTQSDPYLIATPGQLALVGQYAGYYKLKNDIDLSGLPLVDGTNLAPLPGYVGFRREEFGQATPNGSNLYVAAFDRVEGFDGGGHKITGLRQRGYGLLGLFSALGNDNTDLVHVKDLTLDDVNIEALGETAYSNACVGGLVATARAVRITRVKVKGTLKVSARSYLGGGSGGGAGGIACGTAMGIIEQSSFEGAITVKGTGPYNYDGYYTNNSAAGIGGGLRIEGCTARGTISVPEGRIAYGIGPAEISSGNSSSQMTLSGARSLVP